PRWLAITLSLLILGLTLLHPGTALKNIHYPFLSGLLLSTLNPLHLPFWLGWTAVLKAKNILVPARLEYNLFAIAIGAGTALAFLAYGFAGRLILQWLHASALAHASNFVPITTFAHAGNFVK
ncbi:MAG TPA: hypothetical protein VI233_01365, partial [Puia sp.]